MKVVLPDNKIDKKQLAIYITIIIICIISIIIAFYVQFYARIDIARLLGFGSEVKLGNKTEEQTAMLEADFDQLFTNDVQIVTEITKYKPVEEDKPIVYTQLEGKETKANSYDVEVRIPYINIDNEIIAKYNKEIEDFIQKTKSILESENTNTIYTVEYVASVKDDILSLMIRSNLKEGSSAQRVIIQNYNYDLRNNKEITLEEVLKIEGVNKNEIQDEITSKIAEKQKQVEDLKDLGYNIYSRDTKSDMYNVENTKGFYLTEDTLYIIYAYGNQTFTSETDLIIV